MARGYAKIMTSVWEDDEWRSLSAQDQSVFVAMMTSDDTSWCGVLINMPTRIAGFACDLTERKVAVSMGRLAKLRFILVDDRTAEVLVRNYIRHDGLIKRPMITRAMVKAFDKVRSEALRTEIVAQLARVRRDDPDAPGWAHVESMNPDLMARVSEQFAGYIAEQFAG